MNRLEAIRERLKRYTSDATNTDEKLEEGSISEWVMSSDGDMAWLLERVDDLLEALQELGDWLAYGLDKPDGAKPTADDMRRCREVAEKARKAIEKATGK